MYEDLETGSGIGIVEGPHMESALRTNVEGTHMDSEYTQARK